MWATGSGGESWVGVCAQRTFIERVSHTLCLPMCFSRHSAAKAAAFQMGLSHRWGGGLREGLLVNWQSREFGALSLSPTPMLSFPSLPLTNHSLHSFSVAGFIAPLTDVISSLSPLPSTQFSLLISLIEYRSFEQSVFSAPKSTSPYLCGGPGD